jgi:enoyl-CoA hydratase/carnithine racemase
VRVDEPVHGDLDGVVGRVWLNRPHARNAVTVGLARGLRATLADLAPRARVLVVRGVGGHFCAGGDVAEVERLRDEGPAALRVLFDEFGAALASIAALDVPVVAAVEGSATAGGFELMQACDVVVVRDDAVIADNHLRYGQIPGGGSTQRLPRLVGRQRALAHILTGDRLSGADAPAWGLAYRAAPAAGFEAALTEVVDTLARRDPAALAAAKRLVVDGLERPLAEGLAAERDAVVDHVAGTGSQDGFAAFRTRGRT